MQITLRLSLIVYAVILLIVTTRLLQKGRIPEKYSLIWYLFGVVILLVGAVPQVVEIFSDLFGFEVLSNFVIGILIGMLTIICLSLSVMIAGQKKKTTLLIQELSMIKKEIREKK